MTISAEFIDQIVKNVMREMQSRVPMPDAVALVVPEKVESQPSTLHVATKVVSEDVLTAANAAGRTIMLQAGAITTPSGRDYIRKNNVTVSGSAINKPNAANTGTFVVIGSNAICQSAASATGWKTAAAGNEHDAAVIAVQALKSNIIVTCGGEPSVVACLLNRNPDVRAAVITKSTNLMTLTTVMSPQVVCLNSSGWSFGDILKLLRSFSAASRPQGWNEIEKEVFRVEHFRPKGPSFT